MLMSLDRACSTHRREEECMQVFAGKPDGKRLLGYLNVSGRIILKWIFLK
jgi:hypothetical protein